MMLDIVSYDVSKLRMKNSIKLVTSICPYEAKVMSGLKRKSLSWIDDEASDPDAYARNSGLRAALRLASPHYPSDPSVPAEQASEACIRPKLMQPQARESAVSESAT